jgi:hypothetical protein
LKGIITGEELGVLLVDEVGQITSIIEDHVEGLATRESGNGLIDAPEVFFLGFTLPGEDGDTGGGDAGLKSLFFFKSTIQIQGLTQRQRGLGWRRCSDTNN